MAVQTPEAMNIIMLTAVVALIAAVGALGGTTALSSRGKATLLSVGAFASPALGTILEVDSRLSRDHQPLVHGGYWVRIISI